MSSKKKNRGGNAEPNQTLSQPNPSVQANQPEQINTSSNLQANVQRQTQRPPARVRNQPALQSYQKSKPKSKVQISHILRSPVLLVIIVLLIGLLPSLYFYHKSQQAEQKAKAPTSASLQTTAEVVKQVSRHILLPSGEQPTVATVSDASKVRNQAFFANAASGDKVLVYAQAKKAYLYRPSIDRIIEVAPLAPNTTP